MSYTFDEIVNHLSQCIDYVSPTKDKIIIEDSPENVGFYHKSDIVMMFDETGLMIFCTERISTKTGILRFWLCKLKSYFIKDKKGDDIHTFVSRGRNYVDVVLVHKDHYFYILVNSIRINADEVEQKVREQVDAEELEALRSELESIVRKREWEKEQRC
jgi:hypothetical protein